MSLKDLKPNTPKEWATIFNGFSRVCTVISASTVILGNPTYSLITIGVGACMQELSSYMKLHEPNGDDKKQ